MVTMEKKLRRKKAAIDADNQLIYHYILEHNTGVSNSIKALLEKGILSSDFKFFTYKETYLESELHKKNTKKIPRSINFNDVEVVKEYIIANRCKVRTAVIHLIKEGKIENLPINTQISRYVKKYKNEYSIQKTQEEISIKNAKKIVAEFEKDNFEGRIMTKGVRNAYKILNREK